MVNDSGWTTIMHSSVPLVAVLQPLVPLPQERPCRKLKKRRQRRGSEALRTCLKRLQHSRNNHERMQENKTETNRARGEAGPKRVETCRIAPAAPAVAAHPYYPSMYSFPPPQEDEDHQ